MADSQRTTLERWTFDTWPHGVATLFDGEQLERKAAFTASLLVIDDAAELPEVRTALLSVGELYAPDARSLRFSLWPQSRGARALSTQHRAALTFVLDSAFYQVQLRIESSGTTADGLACFAAAIASGEAQRVGYAALKTGITFELTEESRAGGLERWRRQIEQLRCVA